MEGGATTRSRLRTRKGLEDEDDPFLKGDPADLVEVCKQARLHYRKERGVHQKKPTKILDHRDYPALGRYYLLLWHDVGTGTDQDIEDWFAADFAQTFPGLIIDYHKVVPHIVFHNTLLTCVSYPLASMLSMLTKRSRVNPNPNLDSQLLCHNVSCVRRAKP